MKFLFTSFTVSKSYHLLLFVSAFTGVFKHVQIYYCHFPRMCKGHARLDQTGRALALVSSCVVREDLEG